MHINEKLTEQENHAHYMNCLQRKKEIDKFCHKVFFFSIAESAVLLTMMMFGLWLSALSWLPDICGEPFSMQNIFAYLIEFILLPVIAFIGCGKNKICTLIFFAIQCLIILGCFFGGLKTVNTFPFLIGLIGTIVSYPSISAYLDYNQLMKTEGFPSFNNFLANAEDNPEFVSDYSRQYHNKGTDDMFVDIPEKPSPDIQKVSQNSAYMDDIPLTDKNKL